MDGMVLGFFLLAAFLGGLVSGLAGFAMGLVVFAIWLHILTPLQIAKLPVPVWWTPRTALTSRRAEGPNRHFLLKIKN